MRLSFNYKKYIFIFFPVLLFIQYSMASVTLIGTRVIYPANKNQVNLSFRSSDKVPSIIELWVSKSPKFDSNLNDTPFILTPPIFRIEPNSGQSVKLMYNGNINLPQDRESVFYLNFVQYPASNKDQNKLLITYKSTVKLFYRPTTLQQNIDNIGSYLKVDLNNLNLGKLTIINNSEYHVTPFKLTLEKNGKVIQTINNQKMNMIGPFDKEIVEIKPVNKKDIVAYLSIVNDYGGISSYKLN